MIPPPIRYDDVEKEINQTELPLIEKNFPENQTTNDVADVVLAGGTDESYEIPVRFNDAWYNENYELRDK